jgi:hypothetical protein
MPNGWELIEVNNSTIDETFAARAVCLGLGTIGGSASASLNAAQQAVIGRTSQPFDEGSGKQPWKRLSGCAFHRSPFPSTGEGAPPAPARMT